MELIESVLVAADGKPVIMTVMAGGAVCLGLYKDDTRVSAILFIGYPGQAGGQGLADVIFGLYNPSGRLTQTFYKAPFVDEVSFLDMRMRAVEGNPGRGYRFYTGSNIVYPFASGLSYTQFSYQWLDDTKNHNSSLFVITAVEVTNVGVQFAGAEVVLLFLQPPLNSVTNSPIKVLRNFDKVNLLPGESKAIHFILTANDFSLADQSGQFHLIRGDWTVMIGPLSKVISV